MANTERKFKKFSELTVKQSVADNDLLVMATTDGNTTTVKAVKENVIRSVDENYVPQSRKINGQPLTSDVILDVAPSKHRHPNATLQEDGFMSKEDKKDLSMIPLQLADKATKDDFRSLVDQIENLGDGFSSFGEDVMNISDLDNIVNPQTGMGVKVVNDKDQHGNSYVWRYNGTKWDRTPFTTVHGKAVLPEDLKSYVGKNTLFNISQEYNKYNFITAGEAKSNTPLAYRKNGVIVAYSLLGEGWVIEQYTNDDPAMWLEEEFWLPIGGGGGLINVTEMSGLEFDSKEDARVLVRDRDRIPGQLITYKLNSGHWVIDMFTGAEASEWNIGILWISIATQPEIDDLNLNLTDLKTIVNSLQGQIDSKIDGGYLEKKDDEFNTLFFTSNGQVVFEIEVPAGGGGGGTSGIVMKLRAVGGTTIVTGDKEPALIQWDFTSVDEDGSPTGDGSMNISVDNVIVHQSLISQGAGQFDVQNYISIGRNTVKLTVTDSYNNVRSIRYTVQKAELTLKSAFNSSEIYTAKPVAFRYVVTGAGNKTVDFWLNGNQLTSDKISTSGVQSTKMLNEVLPGVNKLLVKATSNIDGALVTSNELYTEFIFAQDGVGAPVIVSNFNQTEVTQFETIRIPFFAYDPYNTVATVQVYIDGANVETIYAPRIEQIFEYRITQSDKVNIRFQCGSALKDFDLIVKKSSEGIEEVVGDLMFRAKAVGKSNNSANKDIWEYGDYKTKFEGFNWQENGWLKDKDNNTVLRLTGNANASINIRPFSSTVTSRGMTYTIEYSTESVTDEEAVIMEQYLEGVGIKITPTSIEINSSETGLKSYLDSSEKVSISFVVQKRTDQRLMEIYINGILSRAIRYSETDRFLNSGSDLKISTAGNNAVVNVYAIRWYSNNLEDSQVLSNYIFDTENSNTQKNVFDRNNIIDEYGNVDYNKVLNYISCMKIIGELPTFKGDKKIVDISFENLQGESKSFYAAEVEIDVQGTSSQFYPRKNFKYKFKYKRNGVTTYATVTLTDTGEVVEEYALSDDTIPAKTFCMKADFAESSGVHNAGLAIITDEILKAANIKTNEEIANPKVRTSVYGYPCLIFHQESKTSTPVFIGKYNFLYDKSAEEVFGFHEGCESWEFKDNTSDICLFRGADFDSTYIDDKGQVVPTWTNHLEGRYPDESMDVSNVRKVFEWVISCKGNPTKFKQEAKNWFVIDNLLAYWVITELYACVDQRAKNQFLSRFEDGKWRFIFYDNDTILGIDNIGTIKFKFDVETEDIVDNGHVFNGWDSELWRLVKDAFWVELTSMYERLRGGKMTYNESMGVFQDTFASRWAERIYNKDGYFKYVEPLMTTGENYLAELQGSRTTHRTWWLKNRFSYMDSRFKTGSYRNDFVSLRLYTPSTWGGVAPNANFTLTSNKPGYVHVLFGQSNSDQVRTKPGIPFEVNAPGGMQFNDTETVVYGASALKDLGNLANKYVGLVDITSAVRLERLIIGSTVANYSNGNFKNLSLGNNTLLREINVAQCPNFGNVAAGSVSSSLNLRNLLVLESFNGSKTALKSVALPESGTLKNVTLPATITNLTLRNQTGFVSEANIKLEGMANISTLVIDNTPALDGYDIAKRALAVNAPLSAIRITNITANEMNESILLRISNMDGVDIEGNVVPNEPYVSGKVYFQTITEYNYDMMRTKFPDLVIEYGELVNKIVFENADVEKIALDMYDTKKLGYLTDSDVKNVKWQGNLTTIGEPFTFRELRYWTGVRAELANLQYLTASSIASGDRRGSNVRFNNCKNLTKLILDDGGERIGDNLEIGLADFLNSTNLAEVSIYGNNSRYSHTLGNLAIAGKKWVAQDLTLDVLAFPIHQNLGLNRIYKSSHGFPLWNAGQNNRHDANQARSLYWAGARNITIENLGYIECGLNGLLTLTVNGVMRNVSPSTNNQFPSTINIIGNQYHRMGDIIFNADSPEDGILNRFASSAMSFGKIYMNAKCSPEDIHSSFSVSSMSYFKYSADLIDLGKHYKIKTFNVDMTGDYTIHKLIIRASEHGGSKYMPELVINGAYKSIQELIVPDSMYDDYIADAVWSAKSVKITKLSESEHAND